MMYRDWGWGWGWGLVGLLVFIAVIVLFVWGIAKLAGHGGHHGWTNGRTPLDIAKERYAKGEITKEQFEQIKKDLNE